MSRAKTTQLQPGQTLKGRYVVQDLIGRGGMAEVHRAVDARTGDTVAVKLLLGTIGEDDDSVVDIMHEARIVARLRHPHIARLSDFGTSPHGRFLVMEYCPGASLDTWLQQLALRDMLGLTHDILSALAYAHARKVIHRDLKPENILVVERADGSLHAKLVDFGVARMGEARTRTVGVAGTPAYISPEVAGAKGHQVGRETDLYAIGILLYEFVSGTLPFTGDNFLSVLFAHVQNPVPKLVPRDGLAVPDGLERIILRLLEKRPQDRFRFASDVSRALRQLALGPESTIAPGVESLQAMPALKLPPPLPPESQVVPTVDAEDDLLKALVSLRADQSDDGTRLVQHILPALTDADHVELIGRAAERDLLLERLHATLKARSARVVLVSGPRGSGTSRLARWVCEKAEEEGLLAHVSCGVGDGSSLPQGGLDTLVERLLRYKRMARGTVKKVVAAELVEPGTLTEAQGRQLVAFLRPKGGGSDAATANPVGLTVRLLRDVASRLPLAVWVDELTGPRAPSFVELLELVVHTRRLTRLQMLVVATVPAPDADTSEADRAVWDTAMELASREPRIVTHIELGPMGSSSLERLADTLLPLSARTREEAVSSAGGSPGNLVQTLLAWASAKALYPDSDGRLHRSRASVEALQAAVENPLAPLLDDPGHGDDTRDAIELWANAAAVIGAEFGRDELAALVERAAERALATDIGIEAFLDLGLWVAVAGQSLRWRDGDLREAVLRGVEATERMRLNGLYADNLAERWSEAADRGAQHDAMAAHLTASGRLDEAAAQLLLAAEQRLLSTQLEAARTRYEQVHALVQRGFVADAAALADEADLGLARVYLDVGDYDAMLEPLDAVDERGRPGLRRHVRGRAAFYRGERARRRGELADATRCFDLAEPRLEAESLDRARVLRGRAGVAIASGDGAAAERHLALAREVLAAELEVDPDDIEVQLLEARVAMALAQATVGSDPEGAEMLLARCMQRFEALGAPADQAEVHLVRVEPALDTGDLERAFVEAKQALERFLDVGDQGGIARALAARGRAGTGLGRIAEAADDLKLANELAQQIDARATMATVQNALAELTMALGAPEDARELHRNARVLAEELGDVAQSAAGRVGEAVALAVLERWDAADNAFRNLDNTVPEPIARQSLRGHWVWRALVQVERGEWAALDQFLAFSWPALQPGQTQALDALRRCIRACRMEARGELAERLAEFDAE